MKKVLLFFLPLLMVSFIDCSQTTTPVSKEPAVEITKTEKTSLDLEDGWKSQWQRLLAAAKKEGTVVVYGAAGSADRNILIKGMRDNFAINAEIMGLRTEQLAARVNSERRAGIFYSDVYIGAPVTAIMGMKPGGYLEKLDETLVLPEVVDPKLWYEEKLPFIDMDHTVFSFTAYPQPAVVINTNMVKIEELNSYFDLLEPKLKGRIIIYDPTLEGTMQTVIAAVGLKLINWDYWKSFVKQEPVIIRDTRLMGEWLAQGKYPVGIGLGAIYAEMRKIGAPILTVEMKEGTHLTAGAGAISLFKNAPHPNAARVLINWLLSREAQNIWAKEKENQSSRVDVPAYIAGGKGREPRKVYFDGISEEYILRRHEYTAKAKEIFGPLLK